MQYLNNIKKTIVKRKIIWQISYQKGIHPIILFVTDTYVQGGIEIQVGYPTGLYPPTIPLQFEQSVFAPKFYNIDKNYKNLV